MGGVMIGLVEISEEQGTLRLSNGSLFRVDPFDLDEVTTWSRASEIELMENQDRVFNYTLTNWDTCSWIRATKVEPFDSTCP